MSELISVCVCTYRRPSLQRTLESIGRLKLPEGTNYELVVIDNDPAGSGRRIVDALASLMRLPMRYDIEPQKGLSSARNRAIELALGAWLALIDDDEIAEPGWLRELLSCAKRFNADAVIGLVQADYDDAVPPWVRNSGMFERWLPRTGTAIGMGEALSGNALLRKELLDAHKLRFAPAFNATGGEDTDFFRRLLDADGRVVSCREAVVREFVPRERATHRYLTRRSLCVGETYARVTHRYEGPGGLLKVAARASVNVVAAAAIAITTIPFGRRTYYRYYLLLARNVGKLRYYLGFRPIEMYG